MLPDTPLDASRPGANLPLLVRRTPGGALALRTLALANLANDGGGAAVYVGRGAAAL